MEESITKSDFKPTIEFQKDRKAESETKKRVDQCDEIHEAYKHWYLFSSNFSRKVDDERCIEAPKVFKLISRDDLYVQVLVK